LSFSNIKARFKFTTDGRDYPYCHIGIGGPHTQNEDMFLNKWDEVVHSQTEFHAIIFSITNRHTRIDLETPPPLPDLSPHKKNM
jgi:hypothetical protein